MERGMWVMITGYGSVGKDTAADYIRSKNPTIEKMSFADPLRHFASILDAYFPELCKTYNQIVEEEGYENAKKHQCVRDHLVKIGHGARTAIYPTIWIDALFKRAESRPDGGLSKGLVVPDCRYKNESDDGEKRGNCMVIRMKKKGCKAKHETEKRSIAEIVPYGILRNDGTKEELYAAIDDMLETWQTFRPIKPMKVYVAGAYTDKEPIHIVQRALIGKHGATITHDWTSVEEEGKEEDTKGTMEARRHRHERWSKYAEKDFKGVVDSDYVVLVFTQPEYAYRGTCTELGIALGLGKKIIALHVYHKYYLGDVIRDTISMNEDSGTYMRNPFIWLPQVRHVYCRPETLESTIGSLFE